MATPDAAEGIDASEITNPSRFWDKVHIRSERDCWPWLAGQNVHHYGNFRIAREGTRRASRTQAHRVAYALHHGHLPAGKVVRHMCGVRLCCNPAHLKVGSQADNNLDMVEARIPREQADQIRADRAEGFGFRELRTKHRRSYGVLKRILDNEIHVDPDWQGDPGGPRRGASGSVSDEDVLAVRKAWSEGRITLTRVADRLDMTPGAASDLLTGRSYRHLDVFPHPRTGSLPVYDQDRKIVGWQTVKPTTSVDDGELEALDQELKRIRKARGVA